MNEFTTAEELRIIAKDGHLASADRAVLSRGADELDMMFRQIMADNAALIEMNRHLVAKTERIIELQKIAAPLDCWSMSTGRVVVQVRPM